MCDVLGRSSLSECIHLPISVTAPSPDSRKIPLSGIFRGEELVEQDWTVGRAGVMAEHIQLAYELQQEQATGCTQIGLDVGIV